MPDPRVLVIAEACNPEWVSIPLEGWSHYQALRDVAQVHLVTQVRNAGALLRAGLREGDDFTAIDHERIVGPLYKLANKLGGSGGKGWTIRTAAYSLAYPWFERLLWKQFAPRLRAGEFDLVHQLTPLSPTASPRTAARCRKIGIPFVWGPINGGVPWPRAFDQARRREREWLSYVRSAHKLMPRYASARRNAAALIIGSRDTWRQMPAKYHDRCIYIPENAVDPARFTRRRQRTATRPIRLVFLGRLVPYKGPDMALEAARPLLERGDVTLDIWGDGPLKPELERLSQSLRGVRLGGWVEHTKVQDVLSEADVLVFPSIREFGGGVALEAMAVGTPAMVVDYGGPAELVTTDSGWLIPLARREEIVSALRSELERIVADPPEVDEKGRRALARLQENFTWPVKARQSRRVYDWVLGRDKKPDFPLPHEVHRPNARDATGRC